MILKRFCGTEENKWTMLMENKVNLPIKIDFSVCALTFAPWIFSMSDDKTEPKKLMEGGKIEVPINSWDTLAERSRGNSVSLMTSLGGNERAGWGWKKGTSVILPLCC